MEHRTNRRFEVNTACKIEGVLTGPFAGTVENISRGGVYLRLAGNSRTRVLPVVGEVVIVDILLPVSKMYGQQSLRCSGTVVRVSNDRKSVPRLAISVDQMQFARAFRSLTVVKQRGSGRNCGVKQ